MRKIMFPEDIKQRMILLGVTNSQLSELTHATQAQLSLFFKKGSRASLKTDIQSVMSWQRKLRQGLKTRQNCRCQKCVL